MEIEFRGTNLMKKKKKYIRPQCKFETHMVFMFESIKKQHTKVGCRQCSSCHG